MSRHAPAPPPRAAMRYVFAIVALGLLIAFHELGHLLFAKLFGVKVLRFSIGFGPPLVAFRRKGTSYSLGAIPLGGFVQIHGMNPHQDGLKPDDETAFLTQRPWKRIVMLMSGSVLNYLLALGVIAGLYVSGTHVPVPLTVGSVEPGSSAARGQLRPGDQLVKLNGAPLPNWKALVARVAESPGQVLELEVLREGKPQSLKVEPRADEQGRGRIGVAQQYVFREHRLLEALPMAVSHVNAVVSEGAALFVRLVSLEGGLQLSSPAGVVRQASQAAASGLDSFLRVLVTISVALAIFNLLPFPALDGGRVLLTALEATTGKKLNPKVETLLHAVGFFALIAMVVFVASAEVRDLVRARKAVPPNVPAVAPTRRIIELGEPDPELRPTKPRPADAGMLPSLEGLEPP